MTSAHVDVWTVENEAHEHVARFEMANYEWFTMRVRHGVAPPPQPWEDAIRDVVSLFADCENVKTGKMPAKAF